MKWIGTFVLVLAVAASGNIRADAAPTDQAVSHTALERQLRKLDVQWLAAVTHGNAAILERMSTSRYIEILPNGQVLTKAKLLKRVSRSNGKAGAVLSLVCFRLRALYGNVAVITDHLTRQTKRGAPRATTENLLGTRIFVKEYGEWKTAAMAVYPVGYKPSEPAVQESEHEGALGPEYAEEAKQVWHVDQAWEAAVRNKDVPVLNYLFTRQCFIILPGPRLADKLELLDFVGKPRHGNEVKAYPGEFKLRSVFGNFAITTDRTVLRGAVVRGAAGPVEFRTLKFYVKQNGAWKIAGASDVSIVRAR